MSTRALLRVTALLGACVLLAAAVWTVAAVAPANEHFERVWERTDRPVFELVANRTWMWGPQASTAALQEPYSDAPGGFRTVQYFDKSRMEINQPGADPNSLWYVTNGLLVNELMTGQMQRGNSIYSTHPPAELGVAGDTTPGNGPTYALLGERRGDAPLGDDVVITQRVDAQGALSSDPALAFHDVRTAYRVQVPGIDHQIAAPFWEFMNSNGIVYENDAFSEAALFVNPFFATGFPVIEPMWMTVLLDGDPTEVLLQCFERRCLTYTPSNPAGWQVENGNVGQHYYRWRYELLPTEPTATVGPTATLAPSVTATSSPTPTQTATSTPSASYELVAAWGAAVQPAQRMVGPAGVAVAPNGDAYIADAVADRIQVLSADGVLLRSWGAPGDGQGELNAPSAVALDANGTVYVADRDNDRIVAYTGSGQFLTTWGTPGDGPGELSGPAGIAVDALGRIYVADSNNHRVQRFDSDGDFIDGWGSVGSGPSNLSFPRGIAVSPTGIVYVADFGNGRVQVFDLEGEAVAVWQDNERGRFVEPAGVGYHPSSGQTVVADSQLDKLIVFDEEGQFVREWGGLSAPVGVVMGADGNVYVTDTGAFRVLVFSLTGALVDVWGTEGEGHGQFMEPTGVALDAQGMVYVVDTGANRVQKFSAEGELLAVWGVSGSVVGAFDAPLGIAIDGQRLFVVDSGNHRIQEFTLDGESVDAWGAMGQQPGGFETPRFIAVDGAEQLFVSDAVAGRVQQFTSNGELITGWGLPPAQGPFEPHGIALREDGMVLVADVWRSQVLLFEPVE